MNTVMERRNSERERIANETLDLLVIGGGIVGSGVVRDASMRGLRVALVEQNDFASGTSSRSSRLLHGGLRYLEQGRVGLVREASLEKKIIHQIAQHLAEPLGFLFPAYQGQGRPLWQLRIGVKLYDLLCSGRNFQPSRGLSRRETLHQLPKLKSDKLSGAAFYFDALTNDARLVIDSLRSAAVHGAILRNYTRFIDAQPSNQGLWECQIEDQLSFEKQTLRTRAIVNATGPWADQIPHSQVKLRLSKGIHLVVDKARLAVPSAVVITEGKRILFVIPWGERVILGTTDTDYTGPPENVASDADDVRYVLETVNRFFPSIGLTGSDVISVWAGLRPLIANPDGSPSDISRAHQIRSPIAGWWDIAGGKLTTYRLMAQQAVDLIARYVGKTTRPCRTAIEPILASDEQTRFSGLTPPHFQRAAIEHFVRKEWALHVEDIFLRRAGWFYYDRIDEEQIKQVVDWMGAELAWDESTRRSEIKVMENQLQTLEQLRVACA